MNQNDENQLDSLSIESMRDLIYEYRMGGYETKLFETYLEGNRAVYLERKKRFNMV